jgi:hypothetical protein
MKLFLFYTILFSTLSFSKTIKGEKYLYHDDTTLDSFYFYERSPYKDLDTKSHVYHKLEELFIDELGCEIYHLKVDTLDVPEEILNARKNPWDPIENHQWTSFIEYDLECPHEDIDDIRFKLKNDRSTLMVVLYDSYTHTGDIYYIQPIYQSSFTGASSNQREGLLTLFRMILN